MLALRTVTHSLAEGVLVNETGTSRLSRRPMPVRPAAADPPGHPAPAIGRVARVATL